MPDPSVSLLRGPDRRFALTVAGIVTALALIPAALGFLAPPTGYTYSGVHVNSPGDYPVYYAWIQSITDGRVLVQGLLTSEATRPFLHSFWLVTGFLARPFDFDARVAFQILRLITIPLGVMAWAWSLKYWIPEPRRWRWALAFLSFAGGLGYWLSLWQTVHGVALSQQTVAMDIWVSEGFNGLTVLHSPHMVASSALLFLAITLLTRSLASGRLKDAVLAGIAASAVGTFHPFHLIALVAVPLVAYTVIVIRERRVRGRDIGRLAVYGLCALPGALSYGLLVLTDASVHQRLTQNVTPTTDLGVTLVSYGLLVPFALVGAYRRLRSPDRTALVLVVWFVVHAFLVYAPVVFQRRLTQGLQFPLTILAFEGLLALRSWLIRTRAGGALLTGAGSGPLIALFLILGFGLSTATVYGSEYTLVLTPKRHSLGDVVYLPKDEVAAFRWLHAHGTPRDLTLGLSTTGLFSAGFSGRRTYVAHGVETLDWNRKRAEAQAFFEDLSSAERQAFLRSNGITVVLETNRERDRGRPLAAEPFLTPVFAGPTTTVYRVTGTGG